MWEKERRHQIIVKQRSKRHKESMTILEKTAPISDARKGNGTGDHQCDGGDISRGKSEDQDGVPTNDLLNDGVVPNAWRDLEGPNTSNQRGDSQSNSTGEASDGVDCGGVDLVVVSPGHDGSPARKENSRCGGVSRSDSNLNGKRTHKLS